MNGYISTEDLLRIRLAFGAASIKGYSVYLSLLNGEKPKGDNLAKFNSVTDEEIKKILTDSHNNGIEILPITSEKYPECLKNIATPPLVLFVKGKLPDFDNLPVVTIVGPRKVSDFGKKAAYSLGLRLSKAGFTVVSGAAVGTDSEALKGSLTGSGNSVGVLACGICYDYLPENRGLRKAITEHGCLLSEHPPFYPTTRYCFPIRNRIMSALSRCTVIIEAGEKSGALVTARHALEQGKDVLCIPGNPQDKNYKGSNALLRDGAIPLIDASDVFNLYLNDFAEKIDLEAAFKKENTKNNKKIVKKSISGLSKDAEIIYNRLNIKKFSLDDLLSFDISSDKLLSIITELEIQGLVNSLPGGFYELT